MTEEPAFNVILGIDEGFHARPYVDSLGYPTIGYGFKIGTKGADIDQFDFSVPRPLANTWLAMLIQGVEEAIHKNSKASLAYAAVGENHARKAVIISMVYQMGMEGLIKFRNMIAAILDKNMPRAAEEMLDSLWAIQTPNRADRLSGMMASGVVDSYYK